MAVGEFAKPIYDLKEELGDDAGAINLVFDELVRYVNGDQIKGFVERFRRGYELENISQQTCNIG
jgi:hypothetical protein